MPTYPAGVVWDLDGTLLDSVSGIAASLNQLLEENGLAALGERSVRGMIGSGVPTLITRALAMFGDEPDDSSLERMVIRFRSIYSQHGSLSTTLFPGAREVLRLFSDAGVRQAICTNKPEAVSRQIVGRLEIDSYFGSLVGGDTLPCSKPDPEMLQTALAELGISAEEALMVGDSAIDVATARRAGVRVAVVTFGYSTTPVRTLGADICIDELSELPDVLSRHPTRAFA